MTVIISATNRQNSRTNLVANTIQNIFNNQGILDLEMISLVDLNPISLSDDMYIKGNQDQRITKMQAEILIPSKKWIIVCPEYNGSYPGILKVWIDILSIHHRNETFKGKKIALIGVASGRAGNARGMDHLTGLLNYLGSHIMPNKLPLSSIESLIDPTSNNLNEGTVNLLKTYVDEVIAY
jgi:chromate reductase, NAD(P)H dehydrogenase (quinone)